MEKYKCENCGHIFEGDLSTTQCPSCGSTYIKKERNGININWKYVGIAIAILVVIIALFAIPRKEDKLTASLSKNGDNIVIKVDGVSASILSKNYKVLVFDNRNREHGSTHFLVTKKVATYPIRKMLEGQCYTFNITTKEGKLIQNVEWDSNGNEYCAPTIPVFPEIDHIEIGVADHINLVWNDIKVVMVNEGQFFYSIIDGQFQSSPIFNNIQPGSYMIVVKNKEGVSVSHPLILNDIKKLAPPLTLQEVQDIFDKVADGSMSASAAQDKLAEGNVNLARAIQPGNIRTLWGVLMEAAMGVKFKVNSFENDPNTNKIKSGTLKISKK